MRAVRLRSGCSCFQLPRTGLGYKVCVTIRTMLRRASRPASPETVRPRAYLALILVALALSACAKKPADTVAPALRTLSGHVRLTGFLVHPDGRFAGTRVVGDADGVRIDLSSANRIIASTLTVDGIYRFTGLGPGTYRTRVTVVEGFSDSTEALTVPDRDVVAGDTLKLVATGALHPTPNPMAPDTRIHLAVADSGFVEIKIRDMAAATVKTLFSGIFVPASIAPPWDGLDDSGQPTPAGLYWVTYVQGTDVRVHLLFK